MNGIHIRFARQEARVSSSDLAKELSLTPQALGTWERNENLSDDKFRTAMVSIGRVKERMEQSNASDTNTQAA